MWKKLKNQLVVLLGGEPFVRPKIIEKNLQGMGYTRREAQKIISDYRAASRRDKTRLNTL